MIIEKWIFKGLLVLSVCLGKIIFANLFYYSTYFWYYSWVLLHFLILFMDLTILFLLIFTFIYSTFSKKVFNFNKISGFQTDPKYKFWVQWCYQWVWILNQIAWVDTDSPSIYIKQCKIEKCITFTYLHIQPQKSSTSLS